jgi:two-component system sensor histidine kinase DesK
MRQSGRSGPERYDFWTRGGLYALLAQVPLFALFIVQGQAQVRPAGAVLFLLLSAADAAVCIALLHVGLSRYLARGPKPRAWLVAAGAGLSGAVLLAGAAAFPGFARTTTGEIPVSTWVALLASAAIATALAPSLSPPALAGLLAASAITASAGPVITGGARSLGPAFAGGLIDLLCIAAALVTCRGSAWSLHLVWELDRSRATSARLSVAEERLRIGRDMHDVLGRNLSLIAVQSELAAQLARRGDEQAAGHMTEVRRVAHDSLREIRAVISGYRAADLDTELAGAQDVLRAAGVSCRVIGDAAGLPRGVQAALGWVVREGTTNIIRHSDATSATIELDLPEAAGAGRTVTLRMKNDRARPPRTGAGGTGLLGLGERLAELGGSVAGHRPGGGHFRLEATLPVCGPATGPATALPAAAAPAPAP